MKLKVIQPPAGVAETFLLFKTVCCNPGDMNNGKVKHLQVKSDIYEVAIDPRVPLGSLVLNKVRTLETPP